MNKFRFIIAKVMIKTFLYNFNFLYSRNLYTFANISMERGKFIVLEGLDRSGKSSLTKFIHT